MKKKRKKGGKREKRKKNTQATGKNINFITYFKILRKGGLYI
jgi:hypothetical protein